MQTTDLATQVREHLALLLEIEPETISTYCSCRGGAGSRRREGPRVEHP